MPQLSVRQIRVDLEAVLTFCSEIIDVNLDDAIGHRCIADHRHNETIPVATLGVLLLDRETRLLKTNLCHCKGKKKGWGR